MFDAGSKEAAGEVRRLGAALGGIRRIVLSHGHYDHRGACRAIGAPVFCHRDDVPDAIGDAGRHYGVGAPGVPWTLRLRGIAMYALRDGGPAEIAGTVSEGDRVGGYEVVALPGHSPGHIGLWSAEERILLASDCFYTLRGRAMLPQAMFDYDHERALESVRRIVRLAPALAWPAHGEPLAGDVAGALEAALRAEPG